MRPEKNFGERGPSARSRRFFATMDLSSRGTGGRRSRIIRGRRTVKPVCFSGQKSDRAPGYFPGEIGLSRARSLSLSRLSKLWRSVERILFRSPLRPVFFGTFLSQQWGRRGEAPKGSRPALRVRLPGADFVARMKRNVPRIISSLFPRRTGRTEEKNLARVLYSR